MISSEFCLLCKSRQPKYKSIIFNFYSTQRYLISKPALQQMQHMNQNIQPANTNSRSNPTQPSTTSSTTAVQNVVTPINMANNNIIIVSGPNMNHLVHQGDQANQQAKLVFVNDFEVSAMPNMFEYWTIVITKGLTWKIMDLNIYVISSLSFFFKFQSI